MNPISFSLHINAHPWLRHENMSFSVEYKRHSFEITYSVTVATLKKHGYSLQASRQCLVLWGVGLWEDIFNETLGGK